MDDDQDRRITDDMEELRAQLQLYSTEMLCEVLEEYIQLVSREGIIGVKEYQKYVTFLTEEINKRHDKPE